MKRLTPLARMLIALAVLSVIWLVLRPLVLPAMRWLWRELADIRGGEWALIVLFACLGTSAWKPTAPNER